MFGHPPVTKEQLTVGTIVIWEERGDYTSHEYWAKVIKITEKGTVTIKFGDREKSLRSYSDLRIPSKHEIAMRRWRSNAPKLETVKVYRNGLGASDRFGYRVELNFNTENSPDVGPVIEAAIAELQQWREWYDSMPKKEKDDGSEISY